MTSTFIGKPCRTCGNTERYSSGNKPCVECLKKSAQERRESGKQAKWIKDNAKHVNAYNNRKR